MKILILLFTITGFLHYTNAMFSSPAGHSGGNEDYPLVKFTNLGLRPNDLYGVVVFPKSEVFLQTPGDIVHMGRLQLVRIDAPIEALAELGRDDVLLLGHDEKNFVARLNNMHDYNNPMVERYNLFIRIRGKHVWETRLQKYDGEPIRNQVNVVIVRVPNTLGPYYFGKLYRSRPEWLPNWLIEHPPLPL